MKETDATMLACSFDEVGRRISRRGSHSPPFPLDSNAGEIANAFIQAGYAIHADGEQFFEIPAPEFRQAIISKRLEWAPDGDEAFDDRSFVLQFEDLKKVRLIAYVNTPEYVFDPESLGRFGSLLTTSTEYFGSGVIASKMSGEQLTRIREGN